MEVNHATASYSLTFKGQLRGELIEPTDPRYDEARKVYNAMISRKPRLIARCADVADVIAAVNFGRENEIRGLDPGRRAQRRRVWVSATMAWSSTSR